MPGRGLEPRCRANRAHILPLDEPGMEGAVGFEPTYRQLRRLVAGPVGRTRPDMVAPEGFQPSSLSVRSGVSYAFERRGHKLGSGPENRTLPCTLIRGDYRLIRPARTPVLTTMEARVGIEPTIGLFCRQPPFHLATAPWQGRGDSNSRRQFWRLLSWPLNDGPVKLCLSVVKEQ